MSHNQREQPLLGKESGGPALMVESSSPSLAFLAAQDAPQPHPDPAVQVGERSAMTVWEVPQPAAQGPVPVRDDGRQTLSLGAPRLGTDRLFELLQALRAWPAIAALKGIAQKVKAARLPSVEDTRLRRVQSQSRRNRPRLHLLQGRTGLRLTGAQEHEVVPVPHHLQACPHPTGVEPVEINIGQQRADDGLNAKGNLGRVGASAAIEAGEVGGAFLSV